MKASWRLSIQRTLQLDLMTLRIPSNQNDSILWPYRSALAWRWGFREKPEDDTCLGDMKDRRDDTVVQEGRNRWNVRIISWKETGSQLVYSRYQRNIWDPCLEGNKPKNELWDMGTETTSSSERHKAKDTKEEKKPWENLYGSRRTDMASPHTGRGKFEMPREDHSWQLWISMTALGGQEWIASPVLFMHA